MKRLLAVLAATAAALPGCAATGPSADEVLSETAANLGKIRSGTLSLRFLAEAGDGEQAGFELDGPVALARPGELPRAEVDYTQIAGSRRGTTTFISTGERAYVVLGNETFELPDEQLQDLRGSEEAAGGGPGLGELRIDAWVEDPEVGGGDDIGGDETDRVTAELNVANAVADIVSLARSVGAGSAGDLPTLDETNRRQLEAAVESATIEILSGKDDRLLRRLVIDIDLEADVPEDLRRALGSLGAAHMRLELTIANPNEPFEVAEPQNAQPLPGG